MKCYLRHFSFKTASVSYAKFLKEKENCLSSNTLVRNSSVIYELGKKHENVLTDEKNRKSK